MCHFAGSRRICVRLICSSRAGVELRREQLTGTHPKPMMVGRAVSTALLCPLEDLNRTHDYGLLRWLVK